MESRRYVIMGAGEVGSHLARMLSSDGHRVVLVDREPRKGRMAEEQLDVGFVLGNGTHVPVLEAAEVGKADLFVAASSSDEANLVAALLAKKVGAPRTVVRVATSEDITRFGRIYERTFLADLLISTQLLTTTRILNAVLGYNTVEVEYLAGGSVQVRRTRVEEGSVLSQKRLYEIDLPRGSLVLAFVSERGLVVPSGAHRAEVGDEALVLGSSAVIDEVEQRISGKARKLGLVIIAGGGSTATTVAAGLEGRARTIRIIEIDRERASELAAAYPRYEIVHADATDMSAIAAEGLDAADAFIALTGNDETNLMACLLAQEVGVPKLTALVQKSETSSLWRKVGLLDVVSPRTVAAERIRSYIDSEYEPHTVRFSNGSAQFIERRISRLSPAAGAQLADVEVPQGLIVAAVIRGGRATVPRGDHRFEVGDEVIVFVREEEAGMANLVFPGGEDD